jgi:hypothetical protein
MVYGAEPILPTDLDYDSPRVNAYDEQWSNEAWQDAIDQLAELHGVTLLRLAMYQ